MGRWWRRINPWRRPHLIGLAREIRRPTPSLHQIQHPSIHFPEPNSNRRNLGPWILDRCVDRFAVGTELPPTSQLSVPSPFPNSELRLQDWARGASQLLGISISPGRASRTTLPTAPIGRLGIGSGPRRGHGSRGRNRPQLGAGSIGTMRVEVWGARRVPGRSSER